MKINRLFPILTLIPVLPLLMATSPMPEPTVYASEYQDFEMSFKEEKKENDFYYYTFHIKNTGVGYIDSLSVVGKSDDPVYANTYNYQQHGYFYQSAYNSTFASIFETPVIAPLEEIDVTFVYQGKFSDTPEFTYTASAYSTFDSEVIVSGDKAISFVMENEYVSGEKIYQEKLNISFDELIAGYNYGAIVKTTYEGKDYFFKVDRYREFNFYTKAQLDDTNTSNTEVIKVIKSEAYYSSSYAPLQDTSIWTVIAVASVLVVTAGVVAVVVTVNHRKEKMPNE